MLELAKYIYKNYPNLKEKVQYWQVLSLLDRNEDKIVIVKDTEFRCTALYAKISDETLWKIEYGFLDLKNSRDIQEVLNDKGNNIHVLYLLADGQNSILKGLRKVIKKENPKTISWFNPEITKLNKFTLKKERTLCHN